MVKDYSQQSRPSLRWVFERPERIIAFGFGSGVIYPGPGTWGTVLGWVLWAVLGQFLPLSVALIVGVVAFIVGCWVSQKVGDELGEPDHSGMNWDEAVAMWLVLCFTPAGFWAQLCAFILFRFFDIVKPEPIRFLDRRFKGGFGVMLDDLLAALYVVIIMVLLVRFEVF